MEEIQFNPYILTVTVTTLVSLITLLWFWPIITHKYWSRRKMPPSPPKLQIIGNLHQLGSHPHHNLHSLAKNHGPLMLLQLGSVPLLVVSSAEWACEIMKTHDLIFASRAANKVCKKMVYGCKDIATAPYGEYWKKMKSIFVLQLMSNKRVQSFHAIREEETALIVKEIEESRGPVDLSVMFRKFTYDSICRSAFGKRYSGTEDGKKFVELMFEFVELAGSIEIGYFIPWLGWVSRVNGLDKRSDRVAKELDQLFESVIQESINNQSQKEKEKEKEKEKPKGESFIDILLQIYTDSTAEVSIDRDSVKGLILDVFLGGTDTSSATLEWAMTELLRHPTVMEKLQREVRGIVKQNQDITNDDLEKMHYLKAVIKESLRFYPPLPVLVPRVARKDVQIKGFDISAGTMVMINAWAIGRDPMSWDEPEKFMPERFLNSSRDFRGDQDFEFIPFGAGRRGCPGISFALASMELLLANLVQKFDWKLPDGVEASDLDMNESCGITVHRVVHLHAVASHTT